MASHHYHHHYQQHQQQQQQQQLHQNSYQAPSCHGCCCSSTNSLSSSPIHPCPLPALDPLVQSIATQIIQSSQNHHLYTRSYEQPLKHCRENHRYQVVVEEEEQKQKLKQQKETRSLLKSLVRRIEALESSLHHLSASPSPSPCRRSSLSLRDLAARTIQTHFRAFMVRRSRTLRHLKDLAFIKSSFNSLQSSVSGKTHIDHVAVSQKAMDLLLKLDSIQGGDPMIRDGKRSISRELVRFLELVEGVSVKRQQLSHKVMKNVKPTETSKKSRVSANTQVPVSSKKVALNYIRTDLQGLGGNHRAYLEKLSSQDEEFEGFSRVSEDDSEEQEEIPRNHHNVISVKPKKSVSFADNGKNQNPSRVSMSSTQEPLSSEDEVSIDELGSSGDDQRELVESLCKEVGELGSSSFSRASDDDDDDDEEPSEVSDDERNHPGEYVKTEVNHGLMNRHFQTENGSFVFSPPAPVHMEDRLDDLKSRKITMKRL